MSTYANDLRFIEKCIRTTYKETISKVDLIVRDKAKYDDVTTHDYHIEQEIINQIHIIEPNAKILSEELNFETQLTERTWIIDPIDGTCNYAHGIDMIGVQCALFDQGKIQLAAIYLPHLDEMYTALRGGGAFLNGKKIMTEQRPVDHSIISFGDFSHNNENIFYLECEIMTRIAEKVERIRMYGSASIDFAFCAAGRLDGNFTFTKNPWDIMPGILLCEEAGMIVTDAQGNEYTYKSDTVAVFSNVELMEACCKR